MARMEQVNEMLRGEIAEIVSREVYLLDGLITITNVKCSANLKSASVLISVLPENLSGTALELLKKNTSLINKYLIKKLHLRSTPKLSWKIDNQERYAADIEKALKELKNDN